MASPKLETIALYNPATGLPLTGQASFMSFDSYVDDTGSALSAPIITEIGASGVYKFTPVFANPAKGISYILNCGTGANPPRTARYMRPEDWNADNANVLSSTLATASSVSTINGTLTTIQTIVQSISDVELGKWVVSTSGPTANQLLLYKPDGTTLIATFDLQDQNGVPTTTNPYRRIPA